MRIGIDAKALSKRFTGIGVYVRELIRWFNEQDTKDEFFLFSNRDFKLDFPLNSNFHKIIYPARVGSWGVMFKLPKLLNDMGIDLFWGPEHCLPLLRCRCKKVVTIHDLAFLRNPGWGSLYNALLQNIMVRPVCRKADKVIAISQATARDIIEILHVDAQHIQVIYNGDSPYNHQLRNFSKEEIAEIRCKYKLPGSYFLFVGTISPRKNIPTIVAAYNRYRQKNRHQQEKLVLVGGLGWRYKKSLQAIKASPYKTDILMAGYCTDVEREFFYRNAQSLLFPSLWEGFGLPIVEAMSVGTPVITSRISSLPEVGGKHAFYTDNPKDADALCSLMEKVTYIPKEERIKLKCNIQEWSKCFSWEKCAMQTLELFKQVKNV